MSRRALLVVALLLLSGCGQSAPMDPSSEALLLLRSGKYDDAIRASSAAITADANNAQAYLYRGRAYHYRNREGDSKLALKDFNEAIRLAPEDADGYYSRALVYRDLGHTELAENDEKAARATDEQLQEAYKQLPEAEQPEVAKAEVAEDKPADKKPAVEEPQIGAAPATSGLFRSEESDRREYERLKRRFEPAGSLGLKREAPEPRTRGIFDRPSLSQIYEDETDKAASKGATTAGTRTGQANDPVANAPPITPIVPSSPFQPRVPSAVFGPPVAPPPQNPFAGNTMSPFAQRPPSPTGRVDQPANPFAPRQQQQPQSYRPTQPMRTLPPPPMFYSEP